MKKIIKSTALTVIFALVFVSCTQKPALINNETIELNHWKFSPGDNVAWAEPAFNDSAWAPIEAGKNWESQGYDKLDGYAWYRATFKLDNAWKESAAFKDSLLFSLGNVDDCYQVFLNGKLLGQNGVLAPANSNTPEIDLIATITIYHLFQSYTLPSNDPRLLWDKENVLAIRVNDHAGNGGMISLPVNIRMKGLKDYIRFDAGSKMWDKKPGGILSKTFQLANLSGTPLIKGTVKMEVIDHETRQIVASASYPASLSKEVSSFEVHLQNDGFKRLTVNGTFTDSKSGSSASNTWGPECVAGWEKYSGNPVLGGDLGTIFDISMLRDKNRKINMYCSWREKNAVALSESSDGVAWSTPAVCIPNASRPCVILKDGVYHIWFSRNPGIWYAKSSDGKNWIEKETRSVLVPEQEWEKVLVLCPHVLWDEQEKLYKMWYSGGKAITLIEPEAIGYATSKDGIHWAKHKDNPVFSANKQNVWEQDKVAACQVIKRKDDYLMYYIGYENVDCAKIGMARSKDGITGWERFAGNPVIQPGNGWDASAVYKPYAIPDPDNNRWLMYYNGRFGCHEQIGVVVHKGMDLGF